MNDFLVLFFAFGGMICATLMTGGIIGLRKSRKLKKQIKDAEPKKDDPIP